MSQMCGAGMRQVYDDRTVAGVSASARDRGGLRRHLLAKGAREHERIAGDDARRVELHRTDIGRAARRVAAVDDAHEAGEVLPALRRLGPGWGVDHEVERRDAESVAH